MLAARQQLIAQSHAITALAESSSSPSLSRISATWTAKERGLLGAFWFLAVLVRLWTIAAVCLDGDEIFSVLVGRQSWHAMTASVVADSVHPPLFYYLLHIWMRIGNESLLWLRLLPTCLSILALLALILFCRELRLTSREINTVAAIAAIHPYVLYYSQHLRMYSLLMLLGFTSLWLFSKLLKSVGRRAHAVFVTLTLVNIGLVYSHYYGWLVVAVECGYAVIWKRDYIRHAMLSLLVVFAAFAPWMWIAASAIRAKGGLSVNLNWIQKPDLLALLWFFVDLAGCAELRTVGPLLAIAIFAFVGVATWVLLSQNRQKILSNNVQFLWIFIVAPVLCSFAASWVLPDSVWGHRHLVFVAAPFFALCSISLWRTTAGTLRFVGLVITAVWFMQASVHGFVRDDKKLAWDRFVLNVLTQEGPTPVSIRIYSVDRYLHYPVRFYLEGLKTGATPGFAASIEAGALRGLSASASRFDVRETGAVAAIVGDHFWVAYSPTSWKQEQPESSLGKRGCFVGSPVLAGDRFHQVRAFPVWCSRSNQSAEGARKI